MTGLKLNSSSGEKAADVEKGLDNSMLLSIARRDYVSAAFLPTEKKN